MTCMEPFGGKADELMAAASEATGGLTDFGEPQSFMPGLTILLTALDSDGIRFTPRGHAYVYQMLVGNLVARLLTEQGWKENPYCLQQDIGRPLIIIGIPRTGTTALHKLLSVDPQFQGLQRWLTTFPMPRPPRSEWETNRWYQACVAGLDEFFAAVPGLRAAHDLRADDVDECLDVLKQNFCSNFFGSCINIPSYDKWWLRQSEAPAYQRLYRVLQLIGANSPEKTWLLKNPGHLANVGLLLDIFPDACIVQTHRDPVKAMPSVCSVLTFGRSIIEGDQTRVDDIGERELAYWGKAVEEAEKARMRAPEQFLDIVHGDFHSDPMRVVKNIYNYFGLKLLADVASAMTDRIARNPEGSHGQHDYTLEDYGLTEVAIRQRFDNYIRRHLVG